MNMTTVRTTEELHAALDAGLGPDQINVEPMTAELARAEGYATAFLEGHGPALEEATLTERRRILALRSMADGHLFGKIDAELQAAIDNGDTPETLALALLTSRRAH
jgi:hypothetical protein